MFIQFTRAIALLAIMFSSSRAAENWERPYAELLNKYVTPTGVRYSAWKKNPEDIKKLDNIVETIATHGSASSSFDDRFAYHINAYNAWVLKLVLDKYPFESVATVFPEFRFFSNNSIILNGKKMSLDTLEKGILAHTFKDPRYHFAVNCASRSCPPLVPIPYQGDKLDQQLDAVTKAFLNTNPEGIKIIQNGKSVQISEVFKWYKDQFTQAPYANGSILGFINHFRDKILPKTVQLDYQPYNWDLNEAH